MYVVYFICVDYGVVTDFSRCLPFVVFLLCDLYFDNDCLMGAWCPGRDVSWLYWLVFTVDTCWLRRRDSLVVAALCLFISRSISRDSVDY
jgi:hypothetical protein